MRRTQYIQIMGNNDIRLIARDKMLITLLFVIIAMGVAMRYALPALDTALEAKGILPQEGGSLRFSDTYPAFVVFLALWQGANIPGIVFGFLLLDEKEDHSLQALRVTPLPFSLYTQYRILLTTTVAFLSIVYLNLSMGLSMIPFWQLIPIALGAALTAALSSLFLATVAQDKVQGLAFTKFIGLAGLTILLGFFAAEPWQWGLGIFPPFLIAKSYWMALEGRALFWLPLLLGVLSQLGLLALLIKRFRRAVVS